MKDFFVWWWKVNYYMALPVAIASGGVCFGLWGKTLAAVIVVFLLPAAISKAYKV